MRLISASSKCSPYGWFRLRAACAAKKAFIPIAGFARFENIDDVWADATAGAHSSAATRQASMRSLMRTDPPVDGRNGGDSAAFTPASEPSRHRGIPRALPGEARYRARLGSAPHGAQLEFASSARG